MTYDGSQLDLFIRRCNLSFNQLMFPDLQRLYEAFLLYKEGSPYSYRLSKMQMDYWAEDKASRMEGESSS